MANETQQLAFHRKHRPKRIIDYAGNNKAKETMLNAMIAPVRPQTVLITGTTGCGKTTLARLLVKEYRCENRNLATGACGVCPSCREIDEYIETGDTSNLVDIKEVDITSDGGKQAIESVLEELEYPSIGGRYKICIFDECHMATRQAQNRMLKIAEEPPENVLLIFCTTNPDKMLETLLNRCQLQLNIQKPSVKELVNLLKEVCKKENKTFDLAGLTLVANRSNLIIRKALINLEEVINEKGSVTFSNVVDVLNVVSDEIMFDFYSKLINKDTMGYVSLIHKIKTQMDFKQFVDNLIDFTKRGIFIYNNINLNGMDAEEMKLYKQLFKHFSVEQIGVLLEKLLDLKDGDAELKLLMMGYTDFTRSVSVSNNSDSLIQVNQETSELAKEKDEHLKNVEQLYEPDESAIESVKEELSQNPSFDDITAMFGNVEVDNIPQM